MYGAQQRKQAFVMAQEPLHPSTRLLVRKSSNAGGVPAPPATKPPAMAVRLMPGTQQQQQQQQQQQGPAGWGGLQALLAQNAGGAPTGFSLPAIPRASASGMAPGGAQSPGCPSPKVPLTRSMTLDGGPSASQPGAGEGQEESPLLPKIRTRGGDSPAPPSLWAKASNAVRARAITLDGYPADPQAAAAQRTAAAASRFGAIATPRGMDGNTTAIAAAAITRAAPAFSPPAPRQLRMCQSLDGRRLVPEPSPAFRALNVAVNKELSDLSTTMLSSCNSSGSETSGPSAAAPRADPLLADDEAGAVSASAPLSAPLGSSSRAALTLPSNAAEHECKSESSVSLSSDSEEADTPTAAGDAPQAASKAVEVTC